MEKIKFCWVCRNIHFDEIEHVFLTDEALLDGSRPSWITTDNCEIIAKVKPTGVKDTLGSDIYEGNIVRFKNGSNDVTDDYEVVFYQTMFCLKPFEDGYGYVPNLQTHIDYMREDGYEIYAVGSIYDKELIEAGHISRPN